MTLSRAASKLWAEEPKLLCWPFEDRKPISSLRCSLCRPLWHLLSPCGLSLLESYRPSGPFHYLRGIIRRILHNHMDDDPIHFVPRPAVLLNQRLILPEFPQLELYKVSWDSGISTKIKPFYTTTAVTPSALLYGDLTTINNVDLTE